jgi:hypothetical protein
MPARIPDQPCFLHGMSFDRNGISLHTGRSGQQLTQQRKPLRCQLDAEKVDTGRA